MFCPAPLDFHRSPNAGLAARAGRSRVCIGNAKPQRARADVAGAVVQRVPTHVQLSSPQFPLHGAVVSRGVKTRRRTLVQRCSRPAGSAAGAAAPDHLGRRGADAAWGVYRPRESGRRSRSGFERAASPWRGSEACNEAASVKARTDRAHRAGLHARGCADSKPLVWRPRTDARSS